MPDHDLGPSFELELIASDRMSIELREQIRDLCSQAYEEDFTAYLQLLSPATHLIARWNGELVSQLAWVERVLEVEGLGSLRSAYIEAVATLPVYQGRGFATALLKQVPGCVEGFQLAALAPSDAEFYRRLGWELWEGPLSYVDPSGALIETPNEQVMIYRLPLTPQGLNLRASLSTYWRPIEVW